MLVYASYSGSIHQGARDMQPMFTDCYCTQFRRTSGALTKIYDEALEPVGLRITQFSLLRSLARIGVATITQLADESALDLTTISRNVKLLIERGWVDVLPGEKDKREKRLNLNESGKAAVRNAMPQFRKAQGRIEKHMKNYLRGPTEAQLIEALETLQKAARSDLEGVTKAPKRKSRSTRAG
jgi:DNA-binding MarR family transcriptional regulator